MCSGKSQLRGFTLIEIVVVIALMALLTTAAALSFTGPIRKVRALDLIEQVRSFNAASRQYARRFGKDVQMVFDLSEAQLIRRNDDKDDNGFRFALPGGYRIERVRLGGRTVDSGEIVIPCSRLGLTRSYTLHLLGPGLDRWITVAGLTGEMTVLAHDRDATDNFDAGAARDDAG